MKKSCLACITAGLLLIGARTAQAQADYRTLQGGPQRQGHNADPANYNSGRSILQWFIGNNTANPYGTITVDDSTPGTSTTQPGQTFNGTTLLGAAGPNTVGNWITPVIGAPNDAYNPYVPSSATAPYHYALSVGAGTSANPTAGATAQWTWTAPEGGLGFSDTYALYVWLPYGYTNNTLGNQVIQQQRYFVYQINFGNGLVVYDVVDTFATGFGWVRLGGGGLPTQAVFAYDGVHPISVSLFNTNPSGAAANTAVYADAFQAVPTHGYYSATPTSAYLLNAAGNLIVDSAGDIDVQPQPSGPHTARITSVFNQLNSTFINGIYTTIPQAFVSNYIMDPESWLQPPTPGGANGVPQASWTYQPQVQSQYNTTGVNPGSPTTGWAQDTVNVHQGSFYYQAPVVATTSSEQTVTYNPTGMLSGSYEIYAYFPGNKNGETYGSAITYNILSGTTVLYTGTVNEAAGGGWVQLSNQNWPNTLNNVTNADTLTVQLTNLSTAASDVGTLAYANAVKFVAPNASYAVSSSPVHAEVTINKLVGATVTPTLTEVVIVADENGKIHCLDEIGNGDGTTTEYWSYPSTSDPTNSSYVDPNLSSGIDGPATSSVPSAIMPTRFNLSTAVIRNADATDSYDRLYIASANGRIYCLDMAGRGDYNSTTNHPGSTQRLWSYPNDYPLPQVSSPFGAIQGSLVYGDSSVYTGGSATSIFVPAATGRIYSLDALGTVSTRSTTLNWTYPTVTAPNLPPIEMTPNLAFGNLYFGTMADPNTGTGGLVIALNAGTGAQQWIFNGTSSGSAAVSETLFDFQAGPATASAATLAETGASYAVNPSDSVYFINSNASVYGFNAHTGALLTDSSNTYFYDTNELGVVSTQNLGINFITTGDGLQNTRTIPMVMIPTTTGQVYGLFANMDDYNRTYSYVNPTPPPTPSPTTNFVSLESFGYGVFGQNLTSLAFSNSRMIGADDAGYMYVWDNDSANYGLDNAGVPPPGPIITPNVNNADADPFRYIHVKFLTPAGYAALTSQFNSANQPTNTNYTYSNVVGDPDAKNPTGTLGWDVPQPPQPPVAFEEGETVNVLVYDFPYYPASSANGEQVTVQFSQNGKSVGVPITGTVHQFSNPSTAPTTDGRRRAPTSLSVNLPSPYTNDDGFAVVSFLFQPGSLNGVTPGPGVITANVTATVPTSSTTSSYQQIASDPSPNYARIPYVLNNPLAFDITQVFGNPQGTQSYANTVQRYVIPVQTNGTIGSYLQSLGYGLDNSTSSVTMNLYDRSLLALVNGVGLTNVKVNASDLAWQGGSATVYNPLPSGFEDLPVNFPNNSLDYPNIGQNQISFSAQSNGIAANPALTGITLNPPTNLNANSPASRLLTATPLTINVNIPLFQPAVHDSVLGAPNANPDDLSARKTDTSGYLGYPQGYYGRLLAYVDPANQGFSIDKPYRQLGLAAGVVPDEKIAMATPTLDLGSLANGTGYALANPYAPSATAAFSPWTSTWAKAYQPFSLTNLSNVNLINLSVAKATDIQTNGLEYPTEFTASANDANAQLDGSLDLWSNLNVPYAPTSFVFSQKPRITDGVGQSILLNPTPRLNANIGNTTTTVQPLNTSLPANQTPEISVSLPFGFPAGTYSTAIRVIEDNTVGKNTDPLFGFSDTLSQVWEPLDASSVEPYSDPSMILSFTSREARLTNSESPYTAPAGPTNFLDNYLTTNSSPAAFAPAYSSPTAMRDSFLTLVTAWSSNESNPAFQPTNSPPKQTSATTPPSPNQNRLIYVYSLPSQSRATTSQVTNPATLYNNVPGSGRQTTALADLDYFTPSSANSWFAPTSGYPSSSLLSQLGNIIAGTENYDQPSFPLTGTRDPTTATAAAPNGATDLGYALMAFVGSAQTSTGAGPVNNSVVFLTKVSTSSAGAVTVSPAASNTSFGTSGNGDDPTTAKGKPTVAQTGTGALVFYGVTAGNSSAIHFSRYSSSATSFGSALPLTFGNGFESVSDPKATIRKYAGVSASKPQNLVDLTFTGKLKGRANSDIYLAEMRLGQPSSGSDWQLVDNSNISVEQPGSGSPFLYFPAQIGELLTAEKNGIYRAQGVEWDRTQTIDVSQYINGAYTELLVPSTYNSDPQSGLISYDTVLGGKVYIDPDLGTVKFTQGFPGPKADIRLTYTPGFLRVSTPGSAASEPTGIFENNLTSDLTGWFGQGDSILSGNTGVQDGRFVFTYNKAGGGGVTQRPYMTTMRFGVKLPTRIALTASGTPVSVNVGSQGPYQLDPSGGAIYFTGADEDGAVTIQYTGVDESTGNPVVEPQFSAGVSLIPEKTEAPVLIDQAINETNLFTFLDWVTYPFSTTSPNPAAPPRPALFWMFYTSTRAGVPDIYMQTIAPRFAPIQK